MAHSGDETDDDIDDAKDREGDLDTPEDEEGDAGVEQPEDGDADADQPEDGDADAEQPEGVDADAEQPEDVDADVDQPEGVDADAEQPEDVDADVDQPEDVDADVDDPQSLRWVGPATAEVFMDAEFSAADIDEKRVSFRMLVDAGANPGVAAKIRREHSLSWSFEAGDGLTSRSVQVRGLGNEEAAWVAASSGDWESEAEPSDDEDGANDSDDEAAWVAASSGSAVDPAETDGSGDPTAAEAAWRERSVPTPTTDLGGVDEEAAELLAEAGINSVRSLATADPEHVADVLDIDEELVLGWYDAALDAEE